MHVHAHAGIKMSMPARMTVHVHATRNMHAGIKFLEAQLNTMDI